MNRNKTGLYGLASFAIAVGLVAGGTAPAWAGTNPTAKCTLFGESTGTLAGHLNARNANSNELDYGGQCDIVRVRVQYKLSSGATTYYWSGWVTNSTSAWTNSYPYTVRGEHDSTRSVLIKSWW